MPDYKNYFKKVLKEDGPNYVASAPNTAGQGGAVGNSSSMYAGGTASGTQGTDTYATGDYRNPFSMGVKRRKKKSKKKK